MKAIVWILSGAVLLLILSMSGCGHYGHHGFWGHDGGYGHGCGHGPGHMRCNCGGYQHQTQAPSQK